MSDGDPPPGDPEAFAPTIAPASSQRPAIPTVDERPGSARRTGVESYQDTVVGTGSPRSHVGAAGDELPLADPAQYVAEREVARGGMGRIIAAHDRVLGRPVALKELLHADPEHAARFRREALITARLQHPAIVPVYQAGRWPSGEPFYAMKLVSGRPLDRAIADAVTLEQRLALLPTITAAVDAIAYAHAKRIVHRDLKPANVLVGDFGEIVVIDWGLAKDLDDDAADSLPGLRTERARPPTATAGTSDDGGLTLAGAVMGTPAYMPPEQARGEAVDERADVFSLGAMLYHLVAGAPPYAATTATDVIAAAIEGKVTALAVRVPEAPTDLTAIITRAMAHESGDRYPSAQALAEELRRFQTGKLVAAHRYTVRERLARFVRKHKAAVAIGAVAALAFAVLGTLALRRIVVERDRAEGQRRLADQRRAAAEQVIDYLISDTRTRLGAIGRKDLLAGIGAQVRDYYRRLADSPTGLGDDERERLAIALYTLGQAEEERGDLAAAEVTLADARAQLERLRDRGDDDPRHLDRRRLMAEVLVESGRILHGRGEYAREVATYRDALVHYQAVLARRPDDRAALLGSASARDLIGDVTRNQGNLDDAFAEYQAAMGARQRVVDAAAPGADDLTANADLATSHLKIASTLQARGDSAGALDEYRACERLRARVATADPENSSRQFELAKARIQVADMARELGDLATAETTYTRALGSLDALLRKDPGNATWARERGLVLSNWGYALIDKGDARNATQILDQALDNHTRLVAKDPSNTSWQIDLSRIHFRLADARLWRGDVRGALAGYHAARDLRLALLGKDPGSPLWRRLVAWSDAKIGYAELLGSNLDAALTAATAARDARAELVAATPAQAGLRNELAQSELLIARIHARAGRATDALAAVDRAIAGVDKLVADDEVNLEWKETLVGALLVRADLAMARGRAADALADADRAVVQGLVAIAAAPASAVWIMLVAEARFTRARTVRARGGAASPAQRETADEDVDAAYALLDRLSENGLLAWDRQPLWSRVRVARLR
ncbi:MAG: protein kinase [Kofleriaceae bacterium]